MRDCIIMSCPPAVQDKAEHLRAGLDAVRHRLATALAGDAGGERAAPAAPLDAAGVQDHATGEQGAGGGGAHPSSDDEDIMVTYEEDDEDALPPGWERVTSRRTGEYFLHADSGRTTKAAPDWPAASSARGEMPPGWSTAVSPSTGERYYVHEGGRYARFEYERLVSEAAERPSTAAAAPEAGGGVRSHRRFRSRGTD